MNDTTQTIRRSARQFFSGTLLSRIAGMLRDLSMAYAFGTQPAIAAFMVAFRFAHLFRRLFGEGALQSAFIPEFEALRLQDEARAFAFFRNLAISLTLFLILLIGLGSGVLAGFLQWGGLTQGNQEIIYLTLLMLPSLLFICLFGLNASLLQCEKSYFTPSVSPVVFNGIWIVSVLYLHGMGAEKAMPRLALGVILACFCQWLLTVPETYSALKRMLSSPWQFRQIASSDLRHLGKPLLLGILGVAASQINNAIDSLFAYFAEPEGPAFLWYAIRLQQLPLALFGIAIAGAVLPPLSRAIKAQRWEEYHHFLHYALYRTWTFMLPLTAALFVMGDSCVNLLYGRGDFGPQSVIGTTYCLLAYSVGLIPTALVLILAPACYAQNNYYLPAAASFLTLLLNLLLNTIFIVGLKWGAVSVALATSLSAWMNLCILSMYLSLRGQTSLISGVLLWKGIRVFAVTLAACLGAYVMRIFILQIPFFSEILLSLSLGDQIKILLYQILTFGILFIMGTFICLTERHQGLIKNVGQMG